MENQEQENLQENNTNVDDNENKNKEIIVDHNQENNLCKKIEENADANANYNEKVEAEAIKTNDTEILDNKSSEENNEKSSEDKLNKNEENLQNENVKEKENKKEEEKPKGSYVENLMKNKNDPKSKKLLSMVSSLGNLNQLDINKVCKTEANLQEDEYAKEQRLKITQSAKNLFKNKNETKVKKFVDQSSSLFANEIYGSNLNKSQNPREILKLKLIPNDKKANVMNLSNEEIKSVFAKKG